MINTITPEQAGIPSAKILEFMQYLEDFMPGTHSILLERGGRIFHECYYAPFHRDYKHRMYSVSKSFVSVAVGLLITDGKLSLTDRFVDLFPEYLGDNHSPLLEEMTVRDMLTMETAFSRHHNWFFANTQDRCAEYTDDPCDKIPGTIFDYDSPGSFMLGAIVERMTGMPFLEFLQRRVLDEIGFSKDAYCLKTPGGHSFSDSAVMCTTRDLLTFARFVMNKGAWNGKQYIDEAYMTAATSRQVDSDRIGFRRYDGCGYGYQFWIGPKGTFFLSGMGTQVAICDPAHDLILAINADNQGDYLAKAVVYHAFLHFICKNAVDPLPEAPPVYQALQDYCKDLCLYFLPGETTSPFADQMNGIDYVLQENPMGIRSIRFELRDDSGTLIYTNGTGTKSLTFGFGRNEFGLFPEEGYSDFVGGAPCPGHKYKCACSAVWAEAQKLQIKVQVIDTYFGNGLWTFSFKDDRICIRMVKHAEAFMTEYEGTAIGRKQAVDG